MPLVFVHGVSNRDTPEYRENESSRDAFLRAYVAPALELDAEKFRILNPYWGDNGVTFRWASASLPESDLEMETFGSAWEPSELNAVADILADAGPGALDIGAVANRSLGQAIDVLWSIAFAAVSTPDQAKVLAESYKRARAYADMCPSPPWLKNLDSGSFVEQLFQVLDNQDNAAAQGAGVAEEQWETFGSSGAGWLDSLKESLGRITSMPGAVVSSVLLTLGRKRTHLSTATFIGDVLQYLKSRGHKTDPGPIVGTVLNDLKIARESLSPLDPKLIVIGHSLGGVISYDILSYFDPTIEVDVLVTVGSQIALFEEMALYRSSQPEFIPDPVSDRLPRPVNVKRWLNVLDPNDVFSFRTEGVFNGVKDFEYETGYGAMAAHSGYFRRPSFYQRLGARLAQGD